MHLYPLLPWWLLTPPSFTHSYLSPPRYLSSLLLQSPEETQAFKQLWHYMNDYGFRDHYKHDMFILHVSVHNDGAALWDGATDLS